MKKLKVDRETMLLLEEIKSLHEEAEDRIRKLNYGFAQNWINFDLDWYKKECIDYDVVKEFASGNDVN